MLIKDKSISIDDILQIKDDIISYLEINPELFRYTKYNFINYEMLYSYNFASYNVVYSVIIDLGIFKYLKSNFLSFRQLIEKISVLEWEMLNIDSLLKLFDLNTDTLVKECAELLNQFLNNHF